MGRVALLALFCVELLANTTCPQRIARMGSHFDPHSQTLYLRLFSGAAERVEASFFTGAHSPVVWKTLLHPTPAGVWEADIPFQTLRENGLLGPSGDLDRPLLYGYRAWGPNWRYTPDWVPGSESGFVADVDAQGNRFNPNKLLMDPYAREVSHDPLTPEFPDENVYLSGPHLRQFDSSLAAPKAIVLAEPASEPTTHLRRAFKDEVIYEMHVRGFTRQDASVPEDERGTYQGATRKIRYLKSLGITAVELLPIHEFQNALNHPVDSDQNNYWGYMTLNYFSPDRNYAMEKNRNSAGAVTAEFKAMIQAFHDAGIKVYLDVVYNHAGEGSVDRTGNFGRLFSFRGLDNRTYYQTAGRSYADHNGCGPNLNCAHPVVRDLIVDSLKYFHALGVDGFRFDLASVLGNTHASGHGFHFDKMPSENLLNRAIRELPARPGRGGRGVDLIAEAWGVGPGTFQLGHFPYHPDKEAGWAEWNGAYRDIIRRSINRVGIHSPTPGEIATRLAGSHDLFGDDGRKPWHSVNFITAHDGFTLNDLVSYNQKQNEQPAPFGPSDGGEDNNISWDQHLRGDTQEQTRGRRRQAARTAMALNLLSFGVPMLMAGDERLRSQNGNNNAYNIDSEGTWVDWNDSPDTLSFREFTRRLIAFRHNHPSLRPYDFLKGIDSRADGIRDLAWYQADGRSAEDRDLPEMERGYMDDPARSFLAYRRDCTDECPEGSIYVAYNWGFEVLDLTLPKPRPGFRWYWKGDTHEHFEKGGNFLEVGKEIAFHDATYRMRERSLAIFIEKPIAVRN